MTTENLIFKKFAQEIKRKLFAPGVPDKSDFGDPVSELMEGDTVNYVLQHHTSEKRKETPHYDLRIGARGRTKGLYSWAVPMAELPGPGEKKLVIQTPIHSHDYGHFSGQLGRGRARGEVKIVDTSSAVIDKITPNVINFSLQNSELPTKYSLVRLNTNRGQRDWLLFNRTDVPVDEGEKQAKMVKEVTFDAVPLQIIDGKTSRLKKRLIAELADTPKKRQKGLSKRSSLKEDHGMFFTRAGGFWMKDCEIPLSIAFMEKSGKIRDIQEMQLSGGTDDELPVYWPKSASVDYALEMASNWFDDNKISVGDIILIDE